MLPATPRGLRGANESNVASAVGAQAGRDFRQSGENVAGRDQTINNTYNVSGARSAGVPVDEAWIDRFASVSSELEAAAVSLEAFGELADRIHNSLLLLCRGGRTTEVQLWRTVRDAVDALVAEVDDVINRDALPQDQRQILVQQVRVLVPVQQAVQGHVRALGRAEHVDSQRVAQEGEDPISGFRTTLRVVATRALATMTRGIGALRASEANLRGRLEMGNGSWTLPESRFQAPGAVAYNETGRN